MYDINHFIFLSSAHSPQSHINGLEVSFQRSIERSWTQKQFLISFYLMHFTRIRSRHNEVVRRLVAQRGL